MSYTERYTEGHFVSVISPQTLNSGGTATANSGYVSLRDYHRAVAIIQVGAIAANGVLNAKLQQAKDTNGTSVKDVTGKAITPLTDTDDDKVVAIEFRTEEFDVDAGFDCLRLLLTATGAADIAVAAQLIRFEGRFQAVGTTEFDEVVD